MRRTGMILTVCAIFITSAQGQGFLNLNFESAYNLPANPGNGVPIPVANALPDWIAYGGPDALSDIYYVSNNFLGAQSSIELEGGSLALSGNFSAGLYDDSSISQTGTVPGGAESLDFEAEGPGPGGSLLGSDLAVTLGGQELSFSGLYDGPNYIEYGANIPADMDGQMEELVFDCQGVGSGDVLLDDIQFSPTVTPEPGELALFGLGAILIARFGQRK